MQAQARGQSDTIENLIEYLSCKGDCDLEDDDPAGEDDEPEDDLEHRCAASDDMVLAGPVLFRGAWLAGDPYYRRGREIGDKVDAEGCRRPYGRAANRPRGRAFMLHPCCLELRRMHGERQKSAVSRRNMGKADATRCGPFWPANVLISFGKCWMPREPYTPRLRKAEDGS